MICPNKVVITDVVHAQTQIFTCRSGPCSRRFIKPLLAVLGFVFIFAPHLVGYHLDGLLRWDLCCSRHLSLQVLRWCCPSKTIVVAIREPCPEMNILSSCISHLLLEKLLLGADTISHDLTVGVARVNGLVCLVSTVRSTVECHFDRFTCTWAPCEGLCSRVGLYGLG
jgi:hypothetical protein